MPLDPQPHKNGVSIDFRYRSNAAYAKGVQELANVLGLSVPLKVDDVTISAEKISVKESDPLYAMEKIVIAFDKISKTIALKLKDDKSNSWGSRL